MKKNQWTRETPKRPGWYWGRYDIGRHGNGEHLNTEPRIFRVDELYGRLSCRTVAQTKWTRLTHVGYWWPVPLDVPEYESWEPSNETSD